MEKIKIMIVDDHNLVREALSAVIRAGSTFEIVATTGDPTEGIELAKQLRPDVLILDINLFPINGFEVLNAVKKIAAQTRVIILSMHRGSDYVKRMMKEGASGYITKTSSYLEIFKAIEQVMEGKTYLCDECKNILTDEALSGQKHALKKLTKREAEIIKCITEGLSSKEISDKIGISLKTVEAHRYNILNKLEMKNASALMHYTYEHCL